MNGNKFTTGQILRKLVGGFQLVELKNPALNCRQTESVSEAHHSPTVTGLDMNTWEA